MTNLNLTNRDIAKNPKFWILLSLFLPTALPVGYWLGTHFSQGILQGTFLYIIFTYSAFVIFLYINKKPGLLSKASNLIEKLFSTKLSVFLSVGIAFFLAHWLIYQLLYMDFKPYLQDGIVQLTHAHALSKGELFIDPPENYKFFELEMGLLHDNKWISQYPIGYTAFLSTGVLVGMPWLINLLLGIGSLLLIYFLARNVTSERIARLSFILSVTSPFLVLMTATYMNHVTALFFTLLMIYNFIKLQRKPKLLSAIIIGLSFGIIFITRPYTAVAIAAPIIILSIITLYQNFFSYFLKYLTAAIFALVIMSIQLLYNYYISGDYLNFGYTLLHGKEHTPGFMEIPKSFDYITAESGIIEHTLSLGIGHFTNLLLGINIFLLGWPIPAMLIIIYYFCFHKTTSEMKFLLSCAISPAFFHIFYFYQDWGYGPRFMYEVSGLFLILVAVSLKEFYSALQRNIPLLGINNTPIYGFVVIMIGINITLFTTAFMPILSQKSYYLPDAYEKSIDGNAIIFVENERNFVFRFMIPMSKIYTEKEPPRVIFARNLGKEENKKLENTYPNRKIYYAQKSSKTLHTKNYNVY